MNILTFVFIILSLVIGFCAGWFFVGKTGQQRATVERERLALESDLRTQTAVKEATDQLSGEIATQKAQVASLTAANAGLENQLAQKQKELDVRDKRYDELVAEHQERQAKEEASRREKREEEQTVLKQMAPLQAQVASLMKKLGDMGEAQSLQQGEIAEKLQNVLSMEKNLRDASASLEGALRTTSTRGQWGELQLERILEEAGLINGVHYVTQAKLEAENEDVKDKKGTVIPDAIVYMPQGRAIVIDAKAPFESLYKAQSLNESDPAQSVEKQRLLTEHTKALKGHIKTLSARKYPEALGKVKETLDMVICFLPSESLLSAALHMDNTLLEEAYRNGVALASPTTLWAVLKAVGYSWQQNTLTKEAQNLQVLAKELVKRLSTGIGYINAIGTNLDKSLEAYNKFVRSYDRNILTSAKRVSEMVDIQLPEVSGHEREREMFAKPESLSAIKEHARELEAEPESN